MRFSVKKNVLVVLAAAFFITVFSAPPPAAGQAEHVKPEDIVVAKINGYAVTELELMNMVNNLVPLETYHGSLSDAKFRMYRKKALDTIIENSLIYDMAKKKGTVSEKEASREVGKQIDRIKEGLGSDGYRKFLEANKLTEKKLRDELKRGYVISKAKEAQDKELREKAAASIEEPQVKEYYTKNIEKFKEPEQVRLRSIMVKVDPSATQKDWNEARKKAADLSKRAKKGENFAELAKKHSDDPFAAKGGDMGWAHRGSLMEEIDVVASNMKKGEVSDPVMTIYGFHVIKVEEIKPSVQKKYSEINRERLEKELEEKEFRRLKAEWQEALRKGANIEYIAAEFKK